MLFVIVTGLVIVAFILGVIFAPVVRGDYGAFKAYVESKLHLAEQKAKDGALKTINKL